MNLPLGGSATLPHHFAEHVTDIPPELLVDQHVMFDWDATLTKHGHFRPEPETVAWLGDQAFSGLSITTFNPLLRRAPGMDAWQPTVYGPRLIDNPDGGRRKLVTKLHLSFFTDAAEREGVDTSQVTVVDNTYTLGAQAASRAGCRVILVAPLKHTERPEQTRIGHWLDRMQLARDQRRLGYDTADRLLLQKTA